MIRPLRLFLALNLLIVLLAAPSWGQPGSKSGSGPGGLYHSDTVVTLTGIVIAKTPPSARGLPQLVYLTLRTTSGKITVFMGPDLYVDKLPIQIHNLDEIQVTGSKITWEGRPMILAAEIKKGNQVLKLRDQNGVPVWSGQRHQ